MSVLLFAGLLGGCRGSDVQKPGGPKQVAVVVVGTEPVTLTTELAGRAVASEESEVRPQVAGIVQRRLFEEGSEVKAGQPLFQIEPTLYRAAEREAQADLGNAEAALVAARLKAERYRALAHGQLLSQQDIDDAEASYRQAQASRDASAAALQTARTNLRFATVTAPIGGRIGRSLVTPGALVTASQDDAIAKIQKLDPMNVDLTQSGSQYLALRREIAAGGVLPASTEVRLKLSDGTDYPLPGRLEFADIDVAEDTGTVTLRARFPNPDRQLLPGMYVRAIVEQGVREQAILVPQAAVDRTPRGLAQVWLVGQDGKAHRRELKTSRALGERWLVDDGLAVGERVIVDGMQGLVEDTPVEVAAPTAAGHKD
ncbi:MAG: efflux RND transporter periplasmic adaptor subunit [Pseudomonas sp.]